MPIHDPDPFGRKLLSERDDERNWNGDLAAGDYPRNGYGASVGCEHDAPLVDMKATLPAIMHQS